MGRLAELFTRLPAAVALLRGPDLVFEFANAAYLELVGGRDVVGVPIREALPEIAGQGFFEMLDGVLAGRGPVSGRETVVDLDLPSGRARRFVDFVYQPVPAAGGVSGVLVQAVDVTDHVRTRQALEEALGDLAALDERYRRLFDTLPAGVVYQQRDGTIIAANPAARNILGVDLDEVLGRDSTAAAWAAVRDDGSPFPGPEHPAMVALRTGEVVCGVVMGVAHGSTGQRRWLCVDAVPDSIGADGRPERVYTIFTDITERRAADAALAESERLLTRLRDSNALAIALADERHIYDANDVMLTMIGATRDELDAGTVSWRHITPAEWAAADDRALAEMRATGLCQPFEKELVHRDGQRLPVLLGAAVIGAEPLRWVTYIIDLSAQRRAEADRADARERERAAQAAAAAARDQVEFLLGAGAMLAATRDRDELLRRGAELVLPAFGDWSVVLEPDPGGALRITAVAHRDPARAAAAQQLAGQIVPADSPLAAPLAYRTGTTRLVRDCVGEFGTHQDGSPQLATPGLQPRSVIAAPLITAAKTFGVLTVVRGEERAPFTDADATLVTELARQLALGLGNAELSTREHTVAETLQRAVLPAALPAVDGLDLAAVYLPATAGVSVGGDFYDAFPLGGGSIGLLVGDVVGHDIVAASVMGQLRNGLRMIAALQRNPGKVLADTQRALSRLLPGALATVFYGVLDVATGEFRYANAGHLPPILTSGRRTRFLDEDSGTMLGALPVEEFPTGHCRLASGERLVLFTDGLVEDRIRDLTTGLDNLAAALADNPDDDAAATCELVVTALLGTRKRADDVCVLTTRFRPTHHP